MKEYEVTQSYMKLDEVTGSNMKLQNYMRRMKYLKVAGKV